LYWLQEWLPGEPMRTLTPHHLDLLLKLNDRQANLYPQTQQNWSTYVHDVVFNGESGWSEQLRRYSAESRSLLSALEAASSPHRGLIMPTNDLVHGDLNLGNVLVDRGHISGVIDGSSIGKGSRAIDLAIQVTYCHVDGADPRLVSRLQERILAIADMPSLVVGVVYGVLAVVAFAIDRHGQDGTNCMLRVARRLLDQPPQPAGRVPFEGSRCGGTPSRASQHQR
jgi:hypothetical protein